MKRQLTSILLFSALLMGGASTFVSCTDHESDAAYEVTGSISEELNGRADKLDNSVNDIGKFLGGKIDQNTGALIVDPNVKDGIIGNVQNLTTQLDTKYAELKTYVDEKNAATSTELKSLIDTKINAVNTEIASLKADIAKAKADIIALQTEMTAAKTAIDEAKQAAKDAENKANAAIATAKSNLDQAVSNLKGQIEACKTSCKAYTDEKVNELKGITDDLKNQQKTNANNIQTLFNLHAELQAKVKQDSILLAQVKSDQTELKTAVEDLNTKLDSKVNTDDFNSVKAQVDANKALSEANQTVIDSIKTQMANHVSKTDLNNKATELENAYKAADTALKNEIQAEITKLNEKLNELFNTMLDMLTGIELQATESPITGYENFSFLGAEAHILGTYYGTAAKAVSLGGVDIAEEANQVLIDTTSHENAGVIYATLNPSNVDFTKCTLKIVDSQGNEAPFTATVVKSNRILKYGVSRASNSNLYAIKINLDKKKLNEAKTWTSSDAAALKDVAQNVLDKLRQPGKTRLNIGDAASTIARTFNNRLTAYALQAEQTYTDANGETKTRTITSKMSLAATAIKPVSYDFLKNNEQLKNLDLPTIPTIQSKLHFDDYKIKNWTPIDSMNTIKTSVSLMGMPDIDNIQINGQVVVPKPGVGVEFGGQTVEGVLDPATGKVTVDLSTLDPDVTVTFGEGADKITINKENFKITVPKKDEPEEYDVEIPMTEFNKIIANINSQVGNIIGNVNNIVDQIKGYAETIDGRYITGINNYIQKFEKKLRKANSLLQPAMFYVAGNGSWNQLALDKIGASYLKLQGGKASTVFVASSYTGEIFAPAYKKYVHVTDAPAGAKVSGANLNKVIDGNLHKIGFEADKEGTYEITYEAVDYSGVKVAKKFYVKVVK